jgi:hypothetical protein
VHHCVGQANFGPSCLRAARSLPRVRHHVQETHRAESDALATARSAHHLSMGGELASTHATPESAGPFAAHVWTSNEERGENQEITAAAALTPRPRDHHRPDRHLQENPHSET